MQFYRGITEFLCILSSSLNFSLNMFDSASGPLGPKSDLRGTKWVTFTKAILQVFNVDKNCYESNKGSFRFYTFHFRYIYDSKLQLDVIGIGGWCVLQAARRYRFRNLRFSLRGMKLGMSWYTIQIHPYPQPPYQASAWLEAQ